MASVKIFCTSFALLLALGSCNFLQVKPEAKEKAAEQVQTEETKPWNVFGPMIEQAGVMNPAMNPSSRVHAIQRAVAAQNAVNKVSAVTNKVVGKVDSKLRVLNAVNSPQAQAAVAWGHMNQEIAKVGAKQAKMVAEAAAELQKAQAKEMKRNVAQSNRQLKRNQIVFKVQEKRNEARSTFNEPRANLGWKSTLKRTARESNKNSIAAQNTATVMQKSAQKLQENVMKAGSETAQVQAKASKQLQDIRARTLRWDAASDKRSQHIDAQSAKIAQQMHQSSERLQDKIDSQYSKMRHRDERNDKLSNINEKIFDGIADKMEQRQFQKVVVKGGSKLLDVIQDERDKNEDTRTNVDETLGDFTSRVKAAALNKASTAEQMQHNIASARLVNPSQVDNTQRMAAASSAGVIPMAGSVLPGVASTESQQAAVTAMQAVAARAEGQRLQSMFKLQQEQAKAVTMQQMAEAAGRQAAAMDKAASEKRQKLMQGIVMQSGDLD